MRQLGLGGADGKQGRPRSTIRDPKRASAPDLVDRDYAGAEPNRLWICDLKYIMTGQGFLSRTCVPGRLQPADHRLADARRPPLRARPRHLHSRPRHAQPH
jgi:hypothetical protein